MGTRLLFALAALGALIGLAATLLLVDSTGQVHAADSGSVGVSPNGLQDKAISTPGPGEVSLESTRIAALPTAPKYTGPSKEDARAAIARGEEPEGFGLLIVETFLEGELYLQVQVALRGDPEPLRAREITEPWAFYVPAGSTVILDITEEKSGWIQTETTLAPVSLDVRTLTVDLDPPQIDGEVLLQVRSGVGETPIRDARVLAVSEMPPDVVELSTDRNGNVHVPRGPGFSYVVNAGGYDAASIPAFAASDKAFKIVTLQPHARLFGKIQVQGDAYTRMQLMSGDLESATDRHAVTSATVEPSGSWTIEGISVPKGDAALTGVWLEVESAGTTRTLATDLRIEPGASIELVDPWIGGLPIELEFIYPSGIPVASGTKVFMRREAETEYGSGETLGGITDDRGRIHFPALYIGKWALEVGRAKLPELVVLGDSLQIVVMQGFDCIGGNLSWPTATKRSFGNAHVLLMESGGRSMRGVTTSESGHFRFDFVPVSTSFTIKARLEGSSMFSGDLGGPFDSGEPFKAVLGDLHVAIPMIAVQPGSGNALRRHVAPAPALNFDK